MDPVVSATDFPDAQVQQPPPKRKRGRPRKIPDIAMEMVAQDALNEIRGTLGMDQVTDHLENSPVEPPVNTVNSQPPPPGPIKTVTFLDPPQSPPPVKRGRGRPRKHPLPTGPPPPKRGRGRPRKNPIPPTTPQSTALNTGPEIVTISPDMLQNVTASSKMPTKVAGSLMIALPPKIAALPVLSQNTTLSQTALEVGKLESESSEVDVLGGIDDVLGMDKNPVSAMIVPPPELLPEAKSQVDITHMASITNSGINLDAVVKKNPLLKGLPLIPIPLPSVGGMELPSVTGVVQKRKRGRPPKPKPDGPVVKRPRGRPRKNPLPDSIPKAAPIGVGENAQSPLTASPVVKRGRGRPRKSDTVQSGAKQPLKEKAQAGGLQVSTSLFNNSLTTKQTQYFPQATTPSSEQPLKSTPLNGHATITPLNEQSVKQTPVEKPSDEGSTQPVKRGRGRPRKHPLPTSPAVKRPRGRPRIHPKPDPSTPVVKRKPGRPRKHPLPDSNVPVVKRKRGRPRKNPVSTESVNSETNQELNQAAGSDAAVFVVTVKPLESPVRELDSSDIVGQSPQSTPAPAQPVVKRKRGRPRKNPPAAIPAQSSEPVTSNFPGVQMGDPLFVNEPQSILNASSDSSKTGFQLMLSSSDSEPADSSDLANAIATLEEFPREASPLLDDRFVESSDEDD